MGAESSPPSRVREGSTTWPEARPIGEGLDAKVPLEFACPDAIGGIVYTGFVATTQLEEGCYILSLGLVEGVVVEVVDGIVIVGTDGA